MLVQCPNCKTTYKVSDEVVRGAKPTFRCSRCRHTFEIEAPSERAALESPKKTEEPSSAVNQELSFSFAAAEPAAPAAGNDGAAPTDPVPEARENSAADIAQPQNHWAIDKARAKDEPEFTMPASGQTAEPESNRTERERIRATEKFFDDRANPEESEGAGGILAMASYVDRRASIFPYLTLFALLVIGFSLVAAVGRSRPQFVESMVGHIPLLGGILLKNTYLKNGILIRSLRTGYQSIQGNREVFIVTGIASNQNPVVIREVRITGRIYNEAGKELEQQTIWLGNTISPKIIRGMTGEDIPHLQNLRPLRSFEIPPGDSLPFTIVFLKGTKSAKHFTCQVISAGAEV